MNGEVNAQNVREYASVGQPPDFNDEVNCSHASESGSLDRSVWNLLDYLSGFFERNDTGANFLQMLNNDVVRKLLENFEMLVKSVFRHLWRVQDGASVHSLRAVTQRIRELFGNRL